jgi:hypothetical protein
MSNLTHLRVKPQLRVALYQAGLASAGVNALLLWPIFGNRVAPYDLGRFATSLAIVAVMAPGFSLGLNVFALRNATGADGVLHRSAQSAVGLLGMLYLVICTILLPVGLLLGSSNLLIVSSALSSAATINAVALARAQDRMIGFAIATIVAQTGTLGIALLIMAESQPLAVALGAWTVVNFAVAIGLTRATGSHQLAWQGWPPMRLALRLGIPVIPHLVLSVAIVNGVRAVVGLVIGYDAAAVFQFASIAAGLGLTVIISFAGHETTEVLRETSTPGIRNQLQRSGLRLALLSGILVAATVVMSGEPLARWLPTSIDVNSVRAAVFLTLPAIPFQAVGDLVGVRHLADGRTWALSLGTLLGCLAMAVTVILAGAILGAAAGGLAISVGTAVRGTATILLLPRIKRAPEARWLLTCAAATTVLALALSW